MVYSLGLSPLYLDPHVQDNNTKLPLPRHALRLSVSHRLARYSPLCSVNMLDPSLPSLGFLGPWLAWRVGILPLVLRTVDDAADGAPTLAPPDTGGAARSLVCWAPMTWADHSLSPHALPASYRIFLPTSLFTTPVSNAYAYSTVHKPFSYKIK